MVYGYRIWCVYVFDGHGYWFDAAKILAKPTDPEQVLYTCMLLYVCGNL